MAEDTEDTEDPEGLVTLPDDPNVVNALVAAENINDAVYRLLQVDLASQQLVVDNLKTCALIASKQGREVHSMLLRAFAEALEDFI